MAVVERFATNAFPADFVDGTSDRAGPRLILWDGGCDAQAGSHVENAVVFAELVGAATRARPRYAGQTLARSCRRHTVRLE